jgi:hypothetical protein
MSAIRNAIQELESRRRHIDNVINNLRSLEGAASHGRRGHSPTRTISEEGRRRIAAAQRKRWAAVRAAKGKK